MTFGLVDVSYSLPFGQAVKLTFFAPCWGNRFVLHQIRAKSLWRRLYTIKTEKVTERAVSLSE